MQTTISARDASRYARCIEASRRIRWDIDKDVIRGRGFDVSKKFLPDGISKVNALGFLDAEERKLLSQVQGRTYANMFGMVERFIGAKVLEVSRNHWLGDQTALEALVRLVDEELKHQELFRRLEVLAAQVMPPGYRFLPAANDVAAAVLGKSTWAVLALTCHIELFTQAHYKESIEFDDHLSDLYKDVFLFHWQEESQHAVLDELEWQVEDRKLSEAQRDAAVDDLIDLVAAVDGILQMQAPADVQYFASIAPRPFGAGELRALEAGVLAAYRWQYIVSGVQNPRFSELLQGMTTEAQRQRIGAALAPILA
jgi:hypothetical protein